jgi:major type 1 subunit fimbrin (pilin)
MKSLFSTFAFVSAGLLGVASINAQAADGTVAIRGAVADTTCSINGATAGSQANVSVYLPVVPAGSLAVAGDVAGTSNMGDIQMVLSGCAGLATKAIARFENGSTVDQSNGFLKNEFLGNGAKNVEIRLLNDQLQPIDIRNGNNNRISDNGKPITGGSAILNYFAQYIATGKAEAGPVTTSVEYTMQYE